VSSSSSTLECSRACLLVRFVSFRLQRSLSPPASPTVTPPQVSVFIVRVLIVCLVEDRGERRTKEGRQGRTEKGTEKRRKAKRVAKFIVVCVLRCCCCFCSRCCFVSVLVVVRCLVLCCCAPPHSHTSSTLPLSTTKLGAQRLLSLIHTLVHSHQASTPHVSSSSSTLECSRACLLVRFVSFAKFVVTSIIHHSQCLYCACSYCLVEDRGERRTKEGQRRGERRKSKRRKDERGSREVYCCLCALLCFVVVLFQFLLLFVVWFCVVRHRAHTHVTIHTTSEHH